MATTKNTAPDPHPFTERDPEETPHACYEGVVYLTYTVFDEAIGYEVERIEAIPCRRCAETR